MLSGLALQAKSPSKSPKKSPDNYREEIALYCPQPLMEHAPIRHAVLEAQVLLDEGFRMPVRLYQLLKDSVRDAKVAILLQQSVPENSTDRSYSISPTEDSWGGQYQYTIESPSRNGLITGLFGLLQRHLGYGFIHPEETITPDHWAWPLDFKFSTQAEPRFERSGLQPHVNVPTVFADEVLDYNRETTPMAYRHYLQWLVHNGQNLLILEAPPKLNKWLKHVGRARLKTAHEHGLEVAMRLPDDEVSIKGIQELAEVGVDEVVLGPSWAGIFNFKKNDLPKSIRIRYESAWGGGQQYEFDNNEPLLITPGPLHPNRLVNGQRNWLKLMRRHHPVLAVLELPGWADQSTGLLNLPVYARNHEVLQLFAELNFTCLAIAHEGLETAHWLAPWLLMQQTWQQSGTTNQQANLFDMVYNRKDTLAADFSPLERTLPALQVDSLIQEALLTEHKMNLKAHVWPFLQALPETELGGSDFFSPSFQRGFADSLTTIDSQFVANLEHHLIDSLRHYARVLQVLADRLDLGVTLMKTAGLRRMSQRDYRRKRSAIDELSFALRLTGLRAMHKAHLLEAQVKARKTDFAKDEAVIANLELAAQNRLEQAAFVRKEALQVIDRLVAGFRHARGQQTAKTHTQTGHKYRYYYPLLYLTVWEQEEALVEKAIR